MRERETERDRERRRGKRKKHKLKKGAKKEGIGIFGSLIILSLDASQCICNNLAFLFIGHTAFFGVDGFFEPLYEGQ